MVTELFECDFCHSLSAVRNPERLVFHNVAVDCFEMNCLSCKASWLPQKEEARIDLEIKNKLADQLTAAQAEISKFQSANEELSLLYAEVVTAMPNNFRMIIEDKYKLQSALDVAVEGLKASRHHSIGMKPYREITDELDSALDKIKQLRFAK